MKRRLSLGTLNLRAVFVSIGLFLVIVAVAVSVIGLLLSARDVNAELEIEVTPVVSSIEPIMQQLTALNIDGHRLLVGNASDSAKAQYLKQLKELPKEIELSKYQPIGGIRTQIVDFNAGLRQISGFEPSADRVDKQFQESVQAVAITLAKGDRIVASVLQHLHAALPVTIEKISTLIIAVAIGLAVVLCFFVALSLIGLGASARGMEVLAKECRKIASGDFSARSLDDYPSEARLVITSLNQLCESLSGLTSRIDDGFARLATGDFAHRIDNPYHKSFKQLVDKINATFEQLDTVVSGIRSVSSEVRGGAMGISAGNAELLQRTVQQASLLEETVVTINAIADGVESNAVAANNADELAQQARVKAEDGSRMLKDSMLAMEDIRSASDQINDITSVINAIAFQTNLLALNASVEASRAGEHGLGFAVVANEVRNLAQRTSGAAKQIEGLIANTHRKVRSGVQKVNRSGEMLSIIEASNRSMSELVTSIATSTQKHSSGLSEMTQTVDNMDTMTQQNAGLVEEAKAASVAMEAQSELLDDLVRSFVRQADGGDQAIVLKTEQVQSGSSVQFPTSSFAADMKSPPLTPSTLKSSERKQPQPRLRPQHATAQNDSPPIVVEPTDSSAVDLAGEWMPFLSETKESNR